MVSQLSASPETHTAPLICTVPTTGFNAKAPPAQINSQKNPAIESASILATSWDLVILLSSADGRSCNYRHAPCQAHKIGKKQQAIFPGGCSAVKFETTAWRRRRWL
jgi:hypothetical protein